MVQSYKNESKSQHPGWNIRATAGCDVWYKVTKMRANHNRYVSKSMASVLWCMVQSYKNESKSQPTHLLFVFHNAVMYGTKLQKWEQITTCYLHSFQPQQLWCMVQSYKNESKSQRPEIKQFSGRSCDVWYKVTKMRANHNDLVAHKIQWRLWCMVQSYKNESKSQRFWSW